MAGKDLWYSLLRIKLYVLCIEIRIFIYIFIWSYYRYWEKNSVQNYILTDVRYLDQPESKFNRFKKKIQIPRYDKLVLCVTGIYKYVTFLSHVGDKIIIHQPKPLEGARLPSKPNIENGLQFCEPRNHSLVGLLRMFDYLHGDKNTGRLVGNIIS